MNYPFWVLVLIAGAGDLRVDGTIPYVSIAWGA